MLAVFPPLFVLCMNLNRGFLKCWDPGLLAAFSDGIQAKLDLLANQARTVARKLERDLAGATYADVTPPTRLLNAHDPAF
ncbi:hypothetical protein BSY18_2376 [Blastomonas sp. RAC04]|nr:hypothetical protein BSY18_2376 [Blastomonas sp. RAC04]